MGAIQALLKQGDNLNVMHALKDDYAGKFRFVYIDEPYNTGSLSFAYHDRRSEPEWLLFMRDRLEMLKPLLAADGVIALQCDDNEQARLKVLCDEVFGPECFMTTVVVKMSEATGFKMKHVGTRLPKLKEYIHIYKMDRRSPIYPVYTEKEGWDPEYRNILLNLDPAEMERLFAIRDNQERTEEEIAEADALLSRADMTGLNRYCKDNGIRDLNAFRQDNLWRIFRTVSMPGKANRERALARLKETGQRFFTMQTPKGQLYLLKDFDQSAAQPRMKMLFARDYMQVPVCDLWTDIRTTGLEREGNVSFTDGKKPEKLIRRLLSLFTRPGDWVLDPFAGSGTTGAVCVKAGRSSVSIELEDAQCQLARKRLEGECAAHGACFTCDIR